MESVIRRNQVVGTSKNQEFCSGTRHTRKNDHRYYCSDILRIIFLRATQLQCRRTLFRGACIVFSAQQESSGIVNRSAADHRKHCLSGQGLAEERGVAAQ